jgi:hypothetical protein
VGGLWLRHDDAISGSCQRDSRALGKMPVGPDTQKGMETHPAPIRDEVVVYLTECIPPARGRHGRQGR